MDILVSQRGTGELGGGGEGGGGSRKHNYHMAQESRKLLDRYPKIWSIWLECWYGLRHRCNESIHLSAGLLLQ